MSTRKPSFEVVRSDAGWFARFRAANGRRVWQTEVYTRRRRAVDALNLLLAFIPQYHAARFEVRDVDERVQS